MYEKMIPVSFFVGVSFFVISQSLFAKYKKKKKTSEKVDRNIKTKQNNRFPDFKTFLVLVSFFEATGIRKLQLKTRYKILYLIYEK